MTLSLLTGMVLQVGNLLLQRWQLTLKRILLSTRLVAVTEGSVGYWLQEMLCKTILDEGIDKTLLQL